MEKSKNLILVIGLVLIVFNTMVGLLLSSYDFFVCTMVDLSFVITTGLLYFLFGGNLVNAFKTSLFCVFIFTGLVRTICMACMDDTIKNNGFMLVALGITFFELLLIAITYFLNDK